MNLRERGQAWIKANAAGEVARQAFDAGCRATLEAMRAREVSGWLSAADVDELFEELQEKTHLTTNRPCPVCEALMEALHTPRYIQLTCPRCGHTQSVK